MEFEDNIKEEQMDDQLQATNKLLLEMVKNQKVNAKNIIKVFIVTIGCYTIILLTIIICFFVYEGQFETVERETETLKYEQETTTEDGGNAIGIINNNGDWSYGESEAGSDDNKRENEDKSE